VGSAVIGDGGTEVSKTRRKLSKSNSAAHEVNYETQDANRATENRL